MLAFEELLQLLIGFEQGMKDQITGQHQDSLMNPFKDLLLPLHPCVEGIVNAIHHLLVHAVIGGLCQSTDWSDTGPGSDLTFWVQISHDQVYWLLSLESLCNTWVAAFTLGCVTPFCNSPWVVCHEMCDFASYFRKGIGARTRAYWNDFDNIV